MRRIISVFIFLICCSIANADLSFYGTYYQNLIVNKKSDHWAYSDLNLLYLKLRKPYEGDYKLDGNISFSLFTPSEPNSDEFSYEKSNFNIERLNFQTSLKNFEIKFGRFLPKYSYTNFFQPIDIFLGAQIFKNELVYTGIDGISIRRYFGMLSSAQYIFLPDPVLASSSHYLNFTSNIGSFDFSLIAYYDGLDNIKKAGWGFKGDIIVSVFNETVFSHKNSDNIKIRSSTGFDYSYSKFMFMMEYLYNEIETGLAKIEGLSLNNRNYLYANLFYFEMMGRSAGINGIMNFDDKSVLLSTYYMDEIFNGVTFLIGLYAPFSEDDDGEFSPDKIGNVILNFYIKAKF